MRKRELFLNREQLFFFCETYSNFSEDYDQPLIRQASPAINKKRPAVETAGLQRLLVL